mgnify:CR=1 FL=1
MTDHQPGPNHSREPALLVRRAVAYLLTVAVFNATVVGTGVALFLLFPWGPSYLLGNMIGYRMVGDGLLSRLDPRLAVAAPALLASLLIAVLSPDGRGPFLRALRLTIVDEAGNPPSAARRVCRWAGLCFTAIAWGIPALWVMLDRHGRALHDILSGTRVELLPRRSKESAS